MDRKANELKNFLKKVKELCGFGDMNSYKVVKDFDDIAQGAAQDNIHNIIMALSSPLTFDQVRRKMIVNAEQELDQLSGKV
ncbi:hypothetical protein ACFOG5_02650 [Pedobacter fastidiosus]|uniref:Uncharacterized protein n=1 Tax=Pedobacter fastidiosus TaxID=2765361 RepID=A0ABR7KYH1_9SPHI|nr:hypothetical protein [Pedobacter fastidiosus]MBC6113171.1 hypothetical protein [Pedobacter fastidiosus]